MAEENESQEIRLKNIDKTRNYLIEKIKQNDLMRKKHKKVCTTLNYIEHLLSFYNYWMFFNFCNRIKNVFNNYRNKNV